METVSESVLEDENGLPRVADASINYIQCLS